MGKREPEVIRDDTGEVNKIIYNKLGEFAIIHEIINGKLKRVDKSGIALSAEKYAIIKRQMSAILRGSKKKKTAPLHKKKSKQFVSDRKETGKINSQIEKYIKKHKNSTHTEAMKEVLRSMEQVEILPGLHNWRAHFLAAGIKFLGNGWIATSFWIDQEGKKEKKWRQFFDIFSAIRSQDHTTKFYVEDEGEQKKMVRIQDVIARTNELLICWPTAMRGQKTIVQEDLLSAIQLLEKCRNEYKTQVLEQLKMIVGFRDSRSRVNPGAMAARTIASLSSLYKRLEEVNAIPAKIALRKKMLQWEKARLDILFEFCANQIKVLSRHEAFFGKKLVSTQASIVDSKIKQVVELLETAFSSPYWERSNAARERLTDSQQALRIHNLAKTRRQLLDAQQCLLPLPTDVKKT